MAWIKNGSSTPINQNSGTLPNMSAALLNWFQPMTFGLLVKTVSGFQVVETETQIQFMGVWQPTRGRNLVMKPEGQRRWNYFEVHSDPSLRLEIDDVIIYISKQYRVIANKDYSLYQYRWYELVDDYTGSGPTVAP